MQKVLGSGVMNILYMKIYYTTRYITPKYALIVICVSVLHDGLKTSFKKNLHTKGQNRAKNSKFAIDFDSVVCALLNYF